MSNPHRERPVVVLVGRPNVGKSTLYNRLCGGRDALVANFPGLTRDRRYGKAVFGSHAATLVDTGGVAEQADDDAALFDAVGEQVDAALAEAQLALLVADARAGLTSGEERIARRLRKAGADVLVAVNKIDAAAPNAAAEFAALGFDALPVSAAHRRGLDALRRALAARLDAADARLPPAEDAAQDGGNTARVRVAIVGRPNVGKSTLVNRLLGEGRQVVGERPGTTRDAIDVPFGDYLLIDTAGVRRKGRVEGAVEKFSVAKTLHALDRAQVAVMVTDAREGIVDQDLHVLSYAVEAGSGVLLLVNKWDAASRDERQAARESVERRLVFAPWIPVRFVSGLRGTGVQELLPAIDAIHRAGAFDVKTAALNDILADAVRDHPPPAVRSRPVKLRYAHKGGDHPPAIVVHGNQTDALTPAYIRYLAARFRDALKLVGVPLKIETRTTDNPFAGRRNTLSRRQRKSRERLIRHRRGR